MKIIHIFNELKYSGAEIMYVDAAPLFIANGCDLSVLITAEAIGEYVDSFKQSGFHIFHKPYPKLRNYFGRIIYYKKIIDFLKNEHFDIVHIHSHKTMWGISLCAKIAKKKSIYTFHNVFQSHFYSYFYHIILRWSAKKIFKCTFQTISDSVYENELNIYHNKTIKIYNWYSNNRFFPSNRTEKLLIRKELNISEKSLVLISIGGCSDIKRHSEIIKALSIVIKKYTNCIYLHLGEGNIENDEKELAIALNVSNSIRFYGNQQDVRKYLIASDIYIMPSRFEGIPITTIEAMACNVPCILYNVPGLRDFNKCGKNSFLISEDSNILANQILFLAENPKTLSEVSFNAKIFVEDAFSLEKNANEVFKLYLK